MPNNGNAIMRWINYKRTSYDGFVKALRYINNPKAAPAKYQFLGYMNPGHEVEDLKLINDRYQKPDDTRLYKHLICSFGDPKLSAVKAYDFMTQFLESIGKRYPVAFSIHTNVPKRLHAHAIVGMTDIWTGKKYSQSPQDLIEWRERYDKIAALPEFQMPLLRKPQQQKNYDEDNKGDLINMNDTIKLQTDDNLPLFHPSPVNIGQQPLPPVNSSGWGYPPPMPNIPQQQPRFANMPAPREKVITAMPRDVSLCLAQARELEAATGFVTELGRQFWIAYSRGYEDGRKNHD